MNFLGCDYLLHVIKRSRNVLTALFLEINCNERGLLWKENLSYCMDHGHYPNDYVPSGDALFLARINAF